ncbi:MAG: transposase, partial [Patescibacteria group bacterium]
FCNNRSPAINSFRGENEFGEKMDLNNRGEAIVRIHVFVLMSNHFHFLIEPLDDDAMSIFMHKLGTAYTMYFNKKNKRVGSLFQGPFKAIEVETDSYFQYLPYYIHLNPLDLFQPSWREQKILDPKKAMTFLNNYKWSSYSDYSGKNNYPSLIYKDLLVDVLGGPVEHEKGMREWLKSMSFESIEGMSFESRLDF